MSAGASAAGPPHYRLASPTKSTRQRLQRRFAQRGIHERIISFFGEFAGIPTPNHSSQNSPATRSGIRQNSDRHSDSLPHRGISRHSDSFPHRGISQHSDSFPHRKIPRRSDSLPRSGIRQNSEIPTATRFALGPAGDERHVAGDVFGSLATSATLGMLHL